MNLGFLFASLRPPASRFVCLPLLFVSHKKHERDDEAKFGSCLIIQHRRCTMSSLFAILTRRPTLFAGAGMQRAAIDEGR